MRSMRRKDREIKDQEAVELLNCATYGILSTAGEDNQPYGVPISFVYKNSCIYFHCALSGHKLDNIEQNAKVSFCVVGKTKLLPDQFATEYESAVAFGVASEIKEEEKYNALMWFVEKYSPSFLDEGKLYISQKDKVVRVFKIDINHFSGKARRSANL